MKKEIYIHVGPPKTGTSAVQKWLSGNLSFLEDNGIYYPSHSVDTNGVSSGNVRIIYDVNDDKQLNLNLKRLEDLLENFEASQYSTLLLSSEFFFRRMEELKEHIPSAKFIAYIRNPLEIKESSYNQSVKRHFQLEKINSGRSKRLPYMARLVEFSNKYSAGNLCLRLYGKNYFKNGTIVSDLLSVIGLEHEVSLPIINSSYQFEALEFKRWFNQFALSQYQVPVDRALQGYNSGSSDYSLIPREQYISDSIYYSKVIENYAAELGTAKLAPLIAKMQTPSPKPFFVQKLSDNQFLSVCDYLQKELKTDYYLLTRDIEKVTVVENNNFHKIFSKSCNKKYHYLYILLKIRSKLKVAILHFIRQLKPRI